MRVKEVGESLNLHRRFRRIKESELTEKLLAGMYEIARFNGMKAAIEDSRDFDEYNVGFYVRIYLRMHHKEITYIPGSEIASLVDGSDTEEDRERQKS